MRLLNYKLASIILIVFIAFTFSKSLAQATVNGFIITNELDTVECKLYKYSKKKEEEIHKYKEIVMVKDGFENKMTPSDIAGYGKEGLFYKSMNHKIEGLNREVIFFAKLVVNNGNAVLLYYPGYEFEDGAKYFFKKHTEKSYQMMKATFEVKVQDTPIAGQEYSSYNPNVSLRIIHSEDSFREYFIKYFNDCATIVRKLKTKYYSSSDMVDIFTEYNTCK